MSKTSIIKIKLFISSLNNKVSYIYEQTFQRSSLLMIYKLFFGNRTAGTVGIACVKTRIHFNMKSSTNHFNKRTNKEAKEERCKRKL